MTASMTDPTPREQQLYAHAAAAAIACSSSGDFLQFNVSGREPSPAAQRVRVQQELDEALTGLDAMLRRKKAPPAGTPVATMGRRLAERDERLDAVAGTYTPGPGLQTLAKTITLETISALEGGK
ncbi:hypothetical protein MMAG44476_38085 [Mycolicibacterium mageritense DSM 44476 = CIP 104973]|uniref:Uncharacterized protein n=1 Tax=Mycolicibacterium mageritense TaxID=53462 RepID=A0ABM7I542_MYCME|nr:hypothetical protein [Mycolicibacterium mageritense]MCC9184149.1 hypothetical protein [Mycolicibacterium mageritense]BBX38023.1 hypothetical protein MMAGJ_73050 [Mycolicibacterium mageritense]CDO25309.1 hypothetical protein BN978_05814 [Mycolicibacterium mageritense DSM 44476 = CIP 104973]